MAVSGYNGLIYPTPGDHTGFKLWLFLSVAIHLLLAAAIISPIVWKDRQKMFYTSVCEVDLLPRDKTVKSEDLPGKEEIKRLEKPKEEEIKHEKATTKIEKKINLSKARDVERPDEAISKLREKIYAEEAVEKLKKKIKDKQTALPNGGIKIAARAPARVYHYDELSAELKAYVEKISKVINGAWSLPENLRNKGFKTILSIHVRRDGAIESLWIEEGSGNKFYDESTLRAINKVSPLPPLPKGWKDDAIDLGLIF